MNLLNDNGGICPFGGLGACKEVVISTICHVSECPSCLHLIQVAPSTLAVHLWPPEPVEGIPEPPASEPTAAIIPKGQFHILPPGNAMLLSSDRTVDVGKWQVPIPSTFLLQCFSPPITTTTQVTAHVVTRTQDVARLPPDAAAAAESAAAQSQSANNHYSQLQPFECKLRNSGGRPVPVLSRFGHNLDAFQSWRIYKLEAVSAAHAVPA